MHVRKHIKLNGGYAWIYKKNVRYVDKHDQNLTNHGVVHVAEYLNLHAKGSDYKWKEKTSMTSSITLLL